MNIVLAVDGSPASNAAVHFVASRLRLNGDRAHSVCLINVQPPLPLLAARAAGHSRTRSYHESEAAKVLSPAAHFLRKAGIAPTSKWVVGHPGTKLAEIAQREADLIVMGSHGQTAIGGLLFGSVSSTVLAASDVPALIVRRPTRFAKLSGRPLRIGAAVDGSKDSTAAVSFLLKQRDLFGGGSDITLINVVPDPLEAYIAGFSDLPISAFSPEQAAALQNEMFERSMAPARKLIAEEQLAALEARLISNAPGDAIAAHAKDERLDLLVMGSHGYGALKSVVLGSVATRIAAKCNTPLLVVRSRRARLRHPGVRKSRAMPARA